VEYCPEIIVNIYFVEALSFNVHSSIPCQDMTVVL
jgi:hypothetical protein